MIATYWCVGMSVTQTTSAHRAVSQCQPENLTPVQLDATTIESTAREYLRELKDELDAQGYIPARLTVNLSLSATNPYVTQVEADRLREFVRVASFLGATRVTARFDEVGRVENVRPALAACVERARRDGITLELDGPLSLES